MKKIYLFMAMLVLVASACEENEDTKVFKIDPNAKIYVKPSTNNAKSTLTPIEVVKQAQFLMGHNDSIAGDSPLTWTWVGKDTISEEPALLRWGSDIIYDMTGYGDYGIQYAFINSYDLVICTGDLLPDDTIAYIPNSTMINAKALILEAYGNQDTSAVYSSFKDAFKFIPITGAEWRALKAQGLN